MIANALTCILMMIAGEPSDWAQAGGILGLIIFALFSAMGTFLFVIAKKDKHHIEFISNILQEERLERQTDRQENQKAYIELANAIRDLRMEIKNQRCFHDRHPSHNP